MLLLLIKRKQVDMMFLKMAKTQLLFVSLFV